MNDRKDGASTPLKALYDPIEPYETGMLSVSGGHELYYERCGTPGAKPAVFLHGGPGGGIAVDHRRLFDPERYDILLYDQRGCGQSTPHACLEHNTTEDLIADLEALRAAVGVDRWLLFGGSWGSTLALLYAQRFPGRVSELVLRGIFLMRLTELDWYYQRGTSEVFPEAWQKFRAPIPDAERGDMRAAYQRRLSSSDPAIRLAAAQAWSIWEGSTMRLMPDAAAAASFEDPSFALAFARIENHFFAHGGWIEDGQILRDALRLADIRGTIVQGRYDMVCPARSAWELQRAWPRAQLRLIEGAGHAWTEPGILDALIATTDAYARDEASPVDQAALAR